MNNKQWLEDRATILANLETITFDEIIEYSKKYKIPMPSNEISTWAGLHKARLYVTSSNITDEMREKSKQWLKDNEFSERVY